jgi:hypothetical protein
MGKGSVSSFLTVLLNVGWYGLALGLALATCLAVASLFLDVSHWRGTIPVTFSLDARNYRVAAPSLGVEDARIVGGIPGFGFESVDTTPAPGLAGAQGLRVRGSLRFSTRRGIIFGNAIVVIVFLALALCVLGLLRAVFRTLRDGQPFVPVNATRIRWIGFAVIASEIARSATVFFENYYALTYFSAEGLRFDAWPTLNGFAIVDGLIILVIAEVFRAGTRLDEEQSLTV